MTRKSDISIRVEFYDRESGETLAQDSDWIGNLNDDDVTITASNLAYGLIEEMWGLIDD